MDLGEHSCAVVQHFRLFPLFIVFAYFLRSNKTIAIRDGSDDATNV